MQRKIVQVPMDNDLLSSLDKHSKQEGQSRAEIIRAACRLYLRRLEEEELDRVYVEGYRRIPDDGAIAQAQMAMLNEILEPEEW